MPFFTRLRKRKFVASSVSLIILAATLLGGCAGQEANGIKGNGTLPAGQPSGSQPGAVKPTAEQEAARKRGEEIGPAIQAANEAAEKGN